MTNKLVKLMFQAIIILLLLFNYSALLADETLNVCVSIPPQKFFIDRIGGQYVKVTLMIPPSANPATYGPKPSGMISVTKAKIYFSTGVPFENIWLKRFREMNPKMKISYMGEGIRLLPMKSHGKTHKHTGRYDPHIWLSPPLVMIQARNILDTLVSIDPAHGAFYMKNYQRFMDEIVTLDMEIMRMLRSKRGKAFMVYHPSWGYFAKTYGLVQISVEMEGKEPSPKEVAGLIRKCRQLKIRTIFLQPQFPSKHLQTIAKEAGLKIITADPLAPKWSENLKNFAHLLSINIQ